MSKTKFNVSVSPVEVFHVLKKEMNADLVHEEIHKVEGNKYVGTLIYEKLYMRVSNRVALVVICDNLKDKTEVRVIATGSSEGLFSKFDWGAANNFTKSIEEILKVYKI